MSSPDGQPAVEYAVRWTPSDSAPRIETSPISEAHARRLAWQLRGGQRLFGFVPDATVISRNPGEEWPAPDPADPLRLPQEADVIVQNLLDDMEHHPLGPMQVLLDRLNPPPSTP